MASDPAVDKAMAPAVSRAIAILDLLATTHGQPLGLSDIARALGIAKSSTSNLCAALEEGGLITRIDSGFRLGRHTVELGGAYLMEFDQIAEFYRLCSQSELLSNELVQMAVLDGTDVLYLARREGRTVLRLTAGIGDRFPASLTAVGNALLADLPNEQVITRFRDPQTRPAFTDRSVTTLKGLLARLESTRLRGWSLDEGGVFPNVVGVAVTVPARDAGDNTFALGVSMIELAGGPDRRSAVVAELLKVRDSLSNPMNRNGSG